MKILFCTDGSKISFNAIRNMRCWVDGEVDIISVMDWNFLPDGVNLEAPEFYSFCASSADETLELAQKEVEQAGFSVGKLIKQCGNAAESILEESERYDLVVLGSHGKKGVMHWLGSVSRTIALNSKVCTYISKHENAGKKVLFPIDGAKFCTEALEHLDLSEKEIYICIVKEAPDLLFAEGDVNWFSIIEQQQEDFAAGAIDEVKRVFEEKGLSVEQTAVLTGSAAQQILNYAKEREVDLIVLGSKHKKHAFLSGSIRKRVLENAAADVLISCT